MARFEPARGIERAVAAIVFDEIEDVAREIAEKARALAPYARIAEQIEVDADRGELAARVNANDWISHFWEFGTIHHAARPFLRPAAESSATKFRGRR